MAKTSSGKLRGLKGKLIRIMILVGVLPLILAMVISYGQGNKSLKNVIGTSFQALAYETSTKLDILIRDAVRESRRLSNHPTVYLSVKRFSGARIQLDESARLAREAKLWESRNPEMESLLKNAGSRILQGFLSHETNSNKATKALYITNAEGVLHASINFKPKYLNKDLASWRAIINGDKNSVFIGPIYWDPVSEVYVFEMAFPVKDREGKTIGVFHRIYSAKDFFSSSIESIVFGETGHVMLINAKGVVVDCPILPTGFQLADPNLVRSVTGPEQAWVQTQTDGHGGDDLSIIGFSPLETSNSFIQASGAEAWYTFAWQSSDEVLAPARTLFLWASSAGVLSIILIVVMGSMASNKVVQPVLEIQKTTGRIGRGENVEPLAIQTGDEIEALANEINSMNELLQKAFSGLETKVEEKTKEALYFKEYTEQILMSVPDPILIFDENQKIEYVNKAFEILEGFEYHELAGKSLGEAKLKDEKQWDQILQELKSFTLGEKAQDQPAPESKGRAEYKARDPLAPKQPAGDSQPKSIVTLRDRVFVYRFFDVVTEVEKSGQVGLFLKEITEIKALQDQLGMTEKISSLGRLSAGIAHEINNPLFSISGFTEAIVDETDPEKIQKYAKKILKNSRHIAAIVQNMSGYVRDNKDSIQEVNVNERLEGALEIALTASYSDDVELQKSCSDLPLIKAKPEEIQQIFVNIMTNAVQAMDGKGKLSISSVHANNLIVVKIQDNGPGIPPDYLSKVFDPFFTTKEQGKGTGLGLNIVHRMVLKYGGEIHIDSKVGEGALFTVTLPVST